MSEMLSDDPGEFAAQLMAAGLMGPPAAAPWRAEVMKWPPPWRVHFGRLANDHQDAGLGWHEAEEKAYREMIELRANPRPLAGRMADGSRVVKDPRPMPPMARKRPRKAVREAMPSMFDSMEDGNSTTYGKDV